MNNSKNRKCLTIILAAGEGKRMKSQLPKVLHPVAGLPMVAHVTKTAHAAGSRNLAVVVGNQAELVEETVRLQAENAEFFEQKERLGTAHAVLAAREAIARNYDDVMILFGDVPLIRSETLLSMRQQIANGSSLSVLGFEAVDPTGYGRLVVKDGNLVAIREHKDASAQELEITLCNGGIMLIDGKNALTCLEAISNQNAQKEFYLTDLVEIMNSKGLKVTTLITSESETMGVNNRAELAVAEACWQEQQRETYLSEGVSMQAPDTVFFWHDTKIGADVTIEPNVVFGPAVNIEPGATIRAFSHLEGAEVGPHAVVGPYARLRPGAKLAAKSKVGNFCEVKNAEIGEGAKINHLTYIGDAEIGSGANIGAGTITCNYDGINKHLTRIGPDVFVGSNSALVAPVTISEGAYIASGSVITDEVPEDALAIGRARQANKAGYAAKIRSRNQAMKDAKK